MHYNTIITIHSPKRLCIYQIFFDNVYVYPDYLKKSKGITFRHHAHKFNCELHLQWLFIISPYSISLLFNGHLMLFNGHFIEHFYIRLISHIEQTIPSGHY